MGMTKEKKDAEAQELSQKATKTCLACLFSFLVSIAGGLLLVFWNYTYHPKNSQLWMVPFGLILMVTPVIVWAAVFSSGLISNSMEGDAVPKTSQPLFPEQDSFLEPKKEIKKGAAVDVID